ncbi:PTS fructose transporter subunit IIB [Vibrio rumoiensis]|uniref:protein-N(pi)-phosphohistidine--D-fructose phosphotransferase n=1 Tax=Vibrio rumoiensis 1S-45 TaxID=1188252 RepID=A0A1E5DZD2_9VIBR|nr:fructose PTS transporter subunit IIB [Vibrio rumoiensis]OEF23266.1 PTS fructose transporter subunit IIB [Vibrio rumoiensis 1S-45]
MKIIAVTACPTGIAHTYMAAEALIKSAAKLELNIQVETQGAMGIENKLSYKDINHANIALIASDIDIEQIERFEQIKTLKVTIEEVLTNPETVLKNCLKHAQ